MLNKTIEKVYGLRKKGYHPDAVGIEVEAEFANGHAFVHSDFPTDVWSHHGDGSLVNGMELVCAPSEVIGWAGKDSVFKAELFDFFKRNRVVKSERASTHVHFNCRTRTVLDVLCMITGYYLLENCLFYLCDESRRGNHFCLGLSDSMMNIDTIVRRLDKKELPFIGQDFKYSSLNVGRLGDLGTVEVRIMGSLTNPAHVLDWAEDVATIFTGLSRKWDNPNTVLNEFVKDNTAFIEKYLPTRISRLLRSQGHDLEALCSKALPLLLPLSRIDWVNIQKEYDKVWGDEGRKRGKAEPIAVFDEWGDPPGQDDIDLEEAQAPQRADLDEAEVAEVRRRPFEPFRWEPRVLVEDPGPVVDPREWWFRRAELAARGENVVDLERERRFAEAVRRLERER